MADVVPIITPSSEQKAALIGEALKTLRAAHVLDERDDLDTASLVEWYDHTIPDVRDIRILAGAMEVELANRRGEHVKREGERRGGDSKVSQRNTLTNAAKLQRSRDRVIAKHPAAVKAYVQRKAGAGQVPSLRGAVRAAKAARAATRVTTAKKPVITPTTFAEKIRLEVRERMELVRDQSLTLKELAKRWHVHSDNARRYLQQAALVGNVVQDGDYFTVTLASGMVDLEQFKTNMYAVIQERRKEARDGYNGWRPDNVHTVRQSALLDWIEDEVRPNGAQGQ